MDGERFDTWTRAMATSRPRRRLLAGLAGGAVAVLLGTVGLETAGATDLGCVHVGRRCQRASQCCSGVCRGPRGKKTCRARGKGTCAAGQDVCTQGAFSTTCNGTAYGGSPACNCYQTSGGASFCGDIWIVCAVCARDAECDARTGVAGSACVRNCLTCEVTGGVGCVPPCPVPA